MVDAVTMRWCLRAWIVAHLVMTAVYVPTWRSDSALWSNAVRHAPDKPRPTLNYARALMLEGHVAVAERAFSRTLALAHGAHVPYYDRADAIRAAHANLQTVAVMQSIGALASE